MKTSYTEISPYTTKDGSQIRELMHPDRHANRNQSLAEAIIAVGQETLLHKHLRTEELYHITAGRGRMRLADNDFPVGPGDTVHIPPGTAHAVRNIGDVPLRILCCCAPPYSHDDTIVLTGEDGSAVG
ncbi:MAG TPA: cupin domain-containing protein [Burkholderiales bacterium]|nr:cupin domain-containing protein [Burkholderiales bacterium]